MSVLWCFVHQSKEVQLPTGRDGLGGVASDDETGGSDGLSLHFSNLLSGMLREKSVLCFKGGEKASPAFLRMLHGCWWGLVGIKTGPFLIL